MRKDPPHQIRIQPAQVRRGAKALFAHQFGQPLAIWRIGRIGSRNARRNARRGHRGKFGFGGICTRMIPAGLLDGPNADGAVGPGAGQDHGATVAMLFGQRAEEQVDRRPFPARLVKFRGGDLVVGNVQPAVGGIT